MEALFSYLIKVIVCSSVMFLYYQLFLKDKTFHHYNRFYLLSIVGVSLLLPLIKVEYFTIEVNEKIYLLLETFKTDKTLNSYHNGELYSTIVFSALGLVSFFFIGRLLLGILRIEDLKKEFPKKEWDGIHFYLTNLSDAPFSFFRNLFWKEEISLQSEVGKQILKHEMVHIEQKHSWDKIMLESVTSIFWMNPIFYLIKKEIFLIHEYLADHKAVKKSDTKAFAKMLLASHFSTSILPATSPFISSNLKKRIKMLQKPNTKYSYARRILVLPVLFALAFSYLVNAKNKEIKAVNKSIETTVRDINILKMDTIYPKQKKSFQKESSVQNINSQNLDKEFTIIIKDKELALPKTEVKISDNIDSEEDKITITREDKGRDDFKIFKIMDSQTKVYDHDGNEVSISEKKPMIKSNMLVISTKEADLYVDGKKVSEEEFSKYKVSPEDFKNKDFKTNIKMFKIDRVGDAQRSYAKKLEIISDKAEEPIYESRKISIYGNSDIKIYLDDLLISNEEMRKIDPKIIEKMNIIKNKEDKNKGEIRITTKK